MSVAGGLPWSPLLTGMQRLAVVSSAAALCFAALGCSSGASRQASVGSLPAHTARGVSVPAGSYYTRGYNGYIVGDDDTDDLYHGHKDKDDSVRRYGHDATGSQLPAVEALAKRYYTVAESGNGTRGCALLARSLAARRDFSAVVPQEYAQVASSSLFRGRGCTRVESLLFELDRRTLTAAAAGSPMLTALRVRGRRGYALLSFKTLPERQLPVLYEAGRWRVDALLDSEIL